MALFLHQTLEIWADEATVSRFADGTLSPVSLECSTQASRGFSIPGLVQVLSIFLVLLS